MADIGPAPFNVLTTSVIKPCLIFNARGGMSHFQRTRWLDDFLLPAQGPSYMILVASINQICLKELSQQILGTTDSDVSDMVCYERNIGNRVILTSGKYLGHCSNDFPDGKVLIFLMARCASASNRLRPWHSTNSKQGMVLVPLSSSQTPTTPQNQKVTFTSKRRFTGGHRKGTSSMASQALQLSSLPANQQPLAA